MNNSDFIDSVFSQVRDNEPYLNDNGFCAGVLKQLPTVSEIAFWKVSVINVLFTLIGVTIAPFFIPLQPLLSTLLSQTSLQLSPSTIGIFILAAMVLSVGTYWTVEKGQFG